MALSTMLEMLLSYRVRSFYDHTRQKNDKAIFLEKYRIVLLHFKINTKYKNGFLD